MLASSGSARSDCVEMTKTKIRSAIGFGGEGYEDAEGDTAASAPQSASPVKSAARLAVLRTKIEYLVEEEGAATAEATA